MCPISYEEFLSMAAKKKAQADALADSIVKLVQEVGKDELEYMRYMDLPESLGAKLAPLFAYDKKLEVKNILFEHMYNGYIKHHICPQVKEHLDIIWNLQTKKRQYYGDADYTFEKTLDNKQLRISYIDDHVTMADNHIFLFVEDKVMERVHIRLVAERAKKSFRALLTKRQYKDKKYCMEYGDTRDEGYVLTLNYGKLITETDSCSCSYYIPEMRHAIDHLLKPIVAELESEG